MSAGMLRATMQLALVKNPVTVYRNFRRTYKTISTVRLGPYPKAIYSLDAGQSAVSHYFSVMRQIGALDKPDDDLRVILFPEFALNGVIEQGPGDGTTNSQLVHSAANPHSEETARAVFDEIHAQLSKLSPGFVVAAGGIAVDTGETLPSGKKKGMNVGAVLESHEQTRVYFSKHNESGIDGWDSNRYEVQPGTGPIARTVKDSSGGRSATLGAIICLDMVKGPFSEEFRELDLVAVSSAGTPHWRRMWIENSPVGAQTEIAVADSMMGGRIGGGLFVRGESPKHPYLKGLHSLAGRGLLADILLAAYDFFLAVKPGDALGDRPDYVIRGEKRYSVDGILVWTSDPRELPELPGLVKRLDENTDT
ncbi:hypothetical protein [Microbispora sp. H10670]|uniref:hypothetical protein n=1 Tax=Microbispora sp. H10670 TaxID=2729108 RepID=UPI0015FFB195|nr:hypothetical protein [Microbispora sp. H10670]